MSIYVQHNGQQLGPFTEEQLKVQLTSGAISLQDYVWWEGQKDWVLLSQTQFVSTLSAGVPIASGLPSTTAPTSNVAIWALVCGCASLFCSLFASIPAIILGHKGLKETKANPAIQGRGMAMAGMILGYVFTVFYGLYILFFIVVFAISFLFAVSAKHFPADSASSADQTTNAAPGK